MALYFYVSFCTTYSAFTVFSFCFFSLKQKVKKFSLADQEQQKANTTGKKAWLNFVWSLFCVTDDKLDSKRKIVFILTQYASP